MISKFNLEEVKTCPECGKEFKNNDKRRVYCSDECGANAWKKYMKKRMREIRRKRFTPKMMEKMLWLKNNQQFADDIIIDECWICGSKEDLISHHVKYYPLCITKVLCHSCSDFLHKSLLRGKKCKPRIIKV